MRTQTKYEEMILSEIRTLPLPVLPQALGILRILKDGVLRVSTHRVTTNEKSTGFCGSWQDGRTADEIIIDIVNHRSGYGGRKVEL